MDQKFEISRDFLTADHPERAEFDQLLERVMEAVKPLNEVGDFNGALKTAAAMIICAGLIVGNMASLNIFPHEQLEAWIKGNSQNLEKAVQRATGLIHCEGYDGRVN